MSLGRNYLKKLKRPDSINRVHITDKVKLLCDKSGGRYEPHAYERAHTILDVMEIHKNHIVAGQSGIVLYEGEFKIV